MIAGILFGFVPLAIWLYLVFGRDTFWMLRERDSRAVPAPGAWPSVVAIVPARNEADVIARSLSSLLAQDYAGDFRIILVDDQSEDGTGEAARALAAERLTVLTGAPRPPGWTGKLWAMKQGSQAAAPSAFLWFTDADIAHAPDTLSSLVARAEVDGRVMVSLMARLSCKTAAEHFLIPAFVFFFAMLYPFGAVNDPKKKLAAAAGGCMLVRRAALAEAGGIDVIRQNIIDDVSLGKVMKVQGPIWLGLTNRSVSLRPYEHLADIRRMVARSAYAELDYSPVQLLGTLFALVLVYLAPPFVALFGWNSSQMAAWFAWILMLLCFQPILRFYRLSPFWALALPAIGAVYAGFTVDSAIQHWRGRGGMWKGRAQAPRAKS